MSAPPSPHDRPTLEGARKTNWRVFFLQEWGLLLLAAALAILIWEITSRRVIKPRPLRGVEVRLEIDPALQGRVGAVLTEDRATQNFELLCSERQANEAREALDVDGSPVVTMRITVPPSGKRPLNVDIDHYAWPFPDHHRILVPGTVEAPAGEVFELVPAHPRVDWGDRQQMTTPSPAELEKRGIRVEVTPSLTKVDVLAPSEQKEQPGWQILQPDPIDLSALLADEKAIPFDKPIPYRLFFTRWRKAGKAAWRRQVELPEIQASVRLTAVGREALRNRLVFQLPQEYKAEIDRNRIEGVSTAGQLTFQGWLRGPKSVLDALAKDLGGWAWGVEITDPAGLPDGGMNDGKPSEPKTVTGRIFWYATKPAYRDQGITFESETGQDSFDVVVRYWKRGP